MSASATESESNECRSSTLKAAYSIISEKLLQEFMSEGFLTHMQVDSYEYMKEQLLEVIDEFNPLVIDHTRVRASRNIPFTSANNPPAQRDRIRMRREAIEKTKKMRNIAAEHAGGGTMTFKVFFDNLRISPPMFTDDKGNRVPLTADRALREGRSWMSGVIVDLRVRRETKEESGDVDVKEDIEKDFELFSIPRMITDSNTGFGIAAKGAFIINGYLKVIVPQEHLTHNVLHIRKQIDSQSKKQVVLGHVRCSHVDYIHTPSDDSKSQSTVQLKKRRWRYTSSLYFKVLSSAGDNGLPEVQIRVPYFSMPFSIRDILRYLEPDDSEAYRNAREVEQKAYESRYEQSTSDPTSIVENTSDMGTPTVSEIEGKFRDRLRKREMRNNYTELARPGSLLRRLLNSVSPTEVHAQASRSEPAISYVTNVPESRKPKSTKRAMSKSRRRTSSGRYVNKNAQNIRDKTHEVCEHSDEDSDANDHSNTDPDDDDDVREMETGESESDENCTDDDDNDADPIQAGDPTGSIDSDLSDGDNSETDSRSSCSQTSTHDLANDFEDESYRNRSDESTHSSNDDANEDDTETDDRDESSNRSSNQQSPQRVRKSKRCRTNESTDVKNIVRKRNVASSNTSCPESSGSTPSTAKKRYSKTKDQPSAEKPKRRFKLPPVPTPGVVASFRKEFYPCAGPSPHAKRTAFLRHMDALLRVYTGDRSTTDRDSLKYRSVKTSGMLLTLLIRQHYANRMRTVQQILAKNIQGSTMDYIVKLLRQSSITSGVHFAMAGGVWGVRRTQTHQVGVCQILNTQNNLAALSHLRQLKNPIMAEGKAVVPRRLHKDRKGITCASESPEGANVGLLNTLSVLGCVRTRHTAASRVSNYMLSSPFFNQLIRPLASNTARESPFPRLDKNTGRRIWVILANGVPFATTVYPLRVYAQFKEVRSSPDICHIRCDSGISIWRQDSEIRISTHSGEFLRPLVRVNKQDSRGAISFGARSSIQHIARAILDRKHTHSFHDSKRDGRVRPEISDPTTFEMEDLTRGRLISAERSVQLCGRKGGLWNALIQTGAIEYVTKSEECTMCTVSEFIDGVHDRAKNDKSMKNGFVRYTHCEIHPQASIFGLSASSIPFAHRNQSPRVLYGSAMSKQALGAPLRSPWLGTRGSELCQVHRPITNTLVLNALSKTTGLLGTYVQNVVIAILPFAGYNQEDSYVISRGAVERGLFMNVTYSIQRAHEGQLGSNRIEFGMSSNGKPKPQKSSTSDRERVDKVYGSDGILKKRQTIRGGDVLVHRHLKSRNLVPVPGASSGQRKYDSQSHVVPHHVRWKAGDIETGRMDGRIEWKTSNGGRTVRLRMAQVQEIGIGDKVSSRHGQKGIISRIIPDENMPFTAHGVRPDICINPHAFPSRMTVGQLVEIVAGKVACVEGSPTDGTAFHKLRLRDLFSRLKTAGHSSDCNGRERMIDGISGSTIGYVPIGVVSYMALKHRSYKKIQARGLYGKTNCITRQPTEGRKRSGGIRFGEMERDALVAHGASSILQERLLHNSDHHIAYVCTKCDTLAYNPQSNHQSHIAENPKVEGVPKCPICENKGVRRPGAHVVPVRIPYALRVVYHNMLSQGIRMKFKVKRDETVELVPNS